jgi:anthranilate 1,2-dioxygenase small subunit
MTVRTPDQLAVELMNRHAELLDDDRLEDWLELFLDDATYRVVPRENHDRGLPAAIIQCDNKRMLRDRIVALREANEYNLHYPRHLIGSTQGRLRADGGYDVSASYAVFQTDMDGRSRLFSVGRYRDHAVLVDGELRLLHKLVIVDTFSVPTLLAMPL